MASDGASDRDTAAATGAAGAAVEDVDADDARLVADEFRDDATVTASDEGGGVQAADRAGSFQS